MASAVIGALRVNLGIDSAQFMDGLAKAQNSLKGIGQSMTRVGAGMSAAVTAPLVAFGASVLKTAGDFEAAMSRVGAATGAAGDQMQQLETLARDLGKSTIFSAQEAADAMEILAKNGLSVEQILEGATQASLDLAAATGSDMASAADVASDVMLSFGKNADELTEVVNGVTGVLLESKFGFDDYRLAIGQAGGVAGSLGVEFNDFNAALTATANLFASGSDAGTSMKTFLQRLVPQSKEASAAMKELGLEFFDSQGNLKSMAQIAEELQTSLAGLSEEARSEALTTIFGTDAMRTAIGLMNQGAEGIDRINASLAEASGAEQAAARLGPYRAAIEQLSGAWEEFQLVLADSGFLEAITNTITKVTEFINKMNESNPALVQWGVAIAAITAAIGPVVVVLGTLAIAIGAIGAPVALAVAAIGSLVAAVVYFREDIYNAMVAVNEFVTGAIDGMILAVQNMATAISTFVTGAWAQFVAAWDGIVAKVDEVKAKIAEFAASIPQLFANLASQMMEIGGQIIEGLWTGIKSKFETVRAGIANFAGSIASSVRSTLGIQSPSRVFWDIGTNIMTGLGMGMQEQQPYVVGIAQQTAQQSVAATKDAWAGMREVTNETTDQFGGLFQSFGQGIADAIKGTKEWSDVLKDLLGQIGQLVLSNIFGGGGGGGFGGLLKGLFGGLLGFASGGSFMVGGAGGIDSQLVMFKASPNERVSVTKPGQEDGFGSGYSPSYYIDARGADQAAVDRMQRGLEERDRQFGRMVDNRVDTRRTRRTRP